MKKVLTLILCLAMTLTMMPSMVFAGEGDSRDATALPAADSNGVITLWQNVTLSDNLIIDDECTLDLNGYTLDMTSHTIAVKGKLVIKDNKAAGQPVVDSNNMEVSYEDSGKIISSGKTVQAQNGGTVILESGTLRSTGDIALSAAGNTSAEANREPVYSTVTVDGGYVFSREYGVGVFGYGATVNVHDGVIEAEDNAAVAGNGTMNASSNQGGTEINISGGTLISNIISSGFIACGIYHPQQGTLNIEGGKIYAENGVGVLMRGGSANITGGEIIATGSVSGKVGDSTIIENCYGVVYDTKSNYPGLEDKDTVVIDEDAVISAENNAPAVFVRQKDNSTEDNSRMDVEGGVFTSDVSEFIGGSVSAANLKSNDVTVYYVGTPAMVSERISAAAKSGDVVTVTQGDADFTLAAGVTVENSGTGEVSSNGQAVESPYVARIGKQGYETLQAAVDAVVNDTETTITLVKNSSGNGVKVPSGRNIIFDLNSYTYDINGKTVGSTGTETNGFQLLKNSDITFKNGTIKSDKAIILIQNYSNLTLENVKLDGTATNNYVLSNNNGNTQLTGSTSIYAAEGKVAFDVCWWPASYPDGPHITVDTTGEIVGNIELGQSGTVERNSKATLTVQNGTFEGQFTVAGNEFVTSKLGENVNIYGGSFSASYGDTLKDEYLGAGMDIYKRTDGTFAVAQMTLEGQTPSLEPTPGYHWEKDENGNYVEVANPYIPPTPTTQNPTIEADANATVVLSSYGTIATITVAEGYELVDVVLNGVSQGKVTTVTGLKTGDRLVVTTRKITDSDEEEAAKNARLKEGVQNTTIKLTSTLGDGFIKLNWKKSLGYKVDYYEVYKSTKRYSGFGTEPYFETKQGGITGWYKNTKELKKGTRYYYKVRGVRDIAGETVYTQWSTKAWRLVK